MSARNQPPGLMNLVFNLALVAYGIWYLGFKTSQSTLGRIGAIIAVVLGGLVFVAGLLFRLLKLPTTPEQGAQNMVELNQKIYAKQEYQPARESDFPGVDLQF